MPPAIRVSQTRLRPGPALQMPNLMVWSVDFARTVQELCRAPAEDGGAPLVPTAGIAPCGAAGSAPGASRRRPPPEIFRTSATVTGHTTPAVADIGCASVRVAVGGTRLRLREGGYLVALGRPGRSLLPAIAGVPGNRIPDLSRVGLAECVVMGRPVAPADSSGSVTFLHDPVLQQLFPAGEQVDVAVLGRVTDFFLGLNAGTWLKIRMKQISEASGSRVEAILAAAERNGGHRVVAEGGAAELLEGTGLAVDTALVEDPPQDAQWLFEHWGAGGNTGVSGQQTYEAFDPSKIY